MLFPRIQTLANSKPRLYCVKPEWSSISPIGINGYPLPLRLLELVENGGWRYKKFDTCPLYEYPNRREIYLFDLPSKPSANLNWPLDAPKEFFGLSNGDPRDSIDLNDAILIGDFGLGSDQPIALDYRHSIANPTVIALMWEDPATICRWLQVATSVDDFANRLGL